MNKLQRLVFHQRLSIKSILQKKLLPSHSMQCYVSANHNDATNFYVPDSTWPKEAVGTYNQLKLLTNDGKWKQYYAPSVLPDTEARSMLRATEGKAITGAIFFNATEQVAKAVITFQNWSEGGQGHVHGGMVATVHDTVMGTLCNYVCGPCVTANLNTNYKTRLPLLTTVLMNAKIDRIENRKVFLNCTMTDTQGGVKYGDASSLFIKLTT